MLAAMLGCWHLQTPPKSPRETSDPDFGLPMGKQEMDRALSPHQPCLASTAIPIPSTSTRGCVRSHVLWAGRTS